MDNKTAEGVVTDAPVSKWRTLMRQHSEKICTLAEDIVLPKYERFPRRTADISMQNIEAQYPPHPSTSTLWPQVERSKHFPVFVIGISLIQMIIFYSFDGNTMLLIFGYDPHRRHEIWRFITMMLVHSSSSHLRGNVCMQCCCGLLEIIHGWKRIGIIYLASVLGGSLFISVLDNGYTMGASAGVYGLLFAQFATLTLNWNEMEKKVCGLVTLVLYVCYDVGLTLYNEFVLKKDLHISHAGHLGGAITGFLVSILVLKNFKIQQWERKMQKICIGILIGICGIVIIVNIANIGHGVPVEWNFHYAQTYLKDYIEAVNKSSILTQECEQENECKLMLDQYYFNGTIST